MNKKGFTLIEVLAIIILLGILITVVVSLVDGDIKFAKDYATESQINLIEDSAEMYYLNYKNEIPSIETTKIVSITVQTLYDKGFIKDKDLKVNTKETVKKTDKVLIYLIDGELFTLYDKTQAINLLIILKGPKELKIKKGGLYTEFGAVLINTVTNTITALPPQNIAGTVNTSLEGKYTINYSYTGATSKYRTIIVESAQTITDSIKPIITLNGTSTMNITLGSSFIDPGASATDNIDGNITSRITKTGVVNTSVKGTYYINYDVIDVSGNKAITQTRVVNVN